MEGLRDQDERRAGGRGPAEGRLALCKSVVLLTARVALVAHDAAETPGPDWPFMGGRPLDHREPRSRRESRTGYGFDALDRPSSRIPANEAHEKGLCHHDADSFAWAKG